MYTLTTLQSKYLNYVEIVNIFSLVPNHSVFREIKITLLNLAYTHAWHYFYTVSGASSCIPANYARFRDLFSEGRTSSPLGTPHPGRFFTTAYSFSCHGVITEWAAYTVNNGSHPIEFHVWRANETLQSVYHLVGMNVFQDALPDSNRLISFKVPLEEQITVSPGDFVGVRTVEQAGSSDEGFALQFDRGDPGSHRRYFRSLTNENFSTPTVLDLRLPEPDFSSLEFLDPFNTVPVIRATKCNFYKLGV